MIFLIFQNENGRFSTSNLHFIDIFLIQFHFEIDLKAVCGGELNQCIFLYFTLSIYCLFRGIVHYSIAIGNI